MKRSNYIIDYRSKDNRYYLFHTYNGNILSLDAEKIDVIEKALEIPDEIKKKELSDLLFQTGFLVDDNRNEFQIVYGKMLKKLYCDKNYLELIIMPTEQCNFRCVYCYETFEKSSMSEEIQENLVDFVQRELPKHRGLSVGWFGGEPLLALNVVENLSKRLIEICKKERKPYMASMTTNAYLLDYKTFERLRRLKINHFQITVDGIKKTHDKQRILCSGAATFDTILKNLKAIKNISRSGLWSISLRTNVTKDVIADRSEFVKEIVNLFNDDKRFHFMIRKMWTNDTEESMRLLCTDEEFEEFIANCNLSHHSLYQEYIFAHDLNYICYASKGNAFVIGADGKVYKCTVALYDDINEVGYLAENGQMILDENKMSYWLAPRIDHLEECKSCPVFAACAAVSCPLKQNCRCNEHVFDMLRPYIPQFAKIAHNYHDITELL